MNGGDIEITVSANYKAFEAGLEQAVNGAGAAGGAAGAGFGENFQKSQVGYIDKALNDIQNKLLKAFGAVAIGQALASTLEQAAAGASFGDAIISSIKSVPIVGTVASIIESSIKLGIGSYDRDAKLRRAKEKLAEAQENLQIALTNQKKEEDQLLDSEKRSGEMASRLSVQQAIATGDKVAEIEANRLRDRTVAELNYREKLGAARSDVEKKNIENAYKYEQATIRTKYDYELKQFNDAQQAKKDKELSDAQEVSRKKGEEIAKQLKAEQDLRKKEDLDAVKSLQDRLKTADKMRSDAAKEAEGQQLGFARSTGSMSTSFGSFNFRGYSDSDKKAVDESILATVREISKKASDFVNTGIQ